MNLTPIATGNQNVKQYFLNIANAPINNIPANVSFTSDVAEISTAKVWQIQSFLIGSDSSAKITIQQSSNGVNWDDLPNATDIVVPQNDSVTIQGSYFSGRYMRVIYNHETISIGSFSTILTIQ